MIITKEDELIEEIIKEFEIPFNRQIIECVHTILWYTHSNFDSIEKFKILVEYLKERDNKDIYGFSKDNPRFTGKMATDGWFYYLEHYAYYVSKVLKAPGIHWLDISRGKYLFPEDIYDIVYKYQNARGEIFLNYMIETQPESMTQKLEYTERIKEVKK